MKILYQIILANTCTKKLFVKSMNLTKLSNHTVRITFIVICIFISAIQTCPSISPVRRKLIFSLNTGRTGSGWLFKLLQTSAKSAFHERNANLWLPLSKKTSQSSRNATRSERMIFCTSVKTWLKKNPHQTYIETSHLFKLFHDLVYECFPPHLYDVRIIILHRYIVQTILSLQRLDFVETCNNGWYYNAGSGLALLPQIFENPTTLDLIIGYILDVEAQIESFIKRNEQSCAKCGACYTIIHTQLEKLQTYSGARQLLIQLGLNVGSVSRVLHKPYNTKGRKLNSSNKTEHIILRRLKDTIIQAREKGIKLPIMDFVTHACVLRELDDFA